MTDIFVDERQCDAIISECGTYRHQLTRRWNGGSGTVAFVMLNPSTADAETDDQTVRRCVDYAQRWGYGALVVGNVFAYRATDPTDLRQRLRSFGEERTVGPHNDAHLRNIADVADRVVVAWGNHGSLAGRGVEVIALLADADADAELYALGMTERGHPRHPSRLPADLEPQPFASLKPGDEGGGST